ncbi:hypothetical protein [Mesorhizobium retamae]|uniref:Carrier domain-containing protein n=1 Tax=Mesorhizobium retamae TaxID=2912854 RepID=A0ABS9QNB3_9HYPH|nr:hypothetical protein [Mesorhizobium sp. IRAMC:0171]MCG7508333.1 hypothetical protein [Mesorhizobium sp. IRAMC:0171]
MMERLFSHGANSLGLWGDGDEIEMIEAVERAFAIRFENAEAEQLVTMGQLFDLVKSKIGNQGAEAITDDALWSELVKHARDAGADPRRAVDRNTTFFSRNAE